MHLSSTTMRNEVNKILAINPGSRYLGLAVFYGTELRDWRIKTTGREEGFKRQKVITSMLIKLIERHDINVLVVKRIHVSRSSNSLGLIRKKISQIGTAKNLALSEYTIEDIKRFFDPYQTKNKRFLMEEVAIRYPDLFTELEREKRHKNPYLVRMFEAIALGIVYVNQMDSGKRKVAKNDK